MNLAESFNVVRTACDIAALSKADRIRVEQALQVIAQFLKEKTDDTPTDKTVSN